MKTRTRRPFPSGLLLWGPVVAWMAAIFFVSGQSQPQVPADLVNTTGHVIAYAVLGLLVVRALAGRLPARITGRMASLAVAISVAYGISDEVHQMFVPGRTPDVMDVVADGAGALLATGACWAWGILSRPGVQIPKPGSH